MGQDTHNITVVSAPIKFTYTNLPIIYNALTDAQILILTDPESGNDECYDVTEKLYHNFCKYKPSNQTEFTNYANEITKELHKDNLLSKECTLLGLEVYVLTNK